VESIDLEGGGVTELTEERLEQLLRAAEEAHGEYEKELGHRDDDWPVWYARFIARQLRGEDE
jgi:hypothetical protein